MRLVLDTNVLTGALPGGSSLQAHLITLWRERSFNLLTSATQVGELRRVTQSPGIRERLSPAPAGRLMNEIRDLAIVVHSLSDVTICTDPHDNYLPAMAVAGVADYLITGDKRERLGSGSTGAPGS